VTRTILVTGATGTVGSALLSRLRDRDATVRAAARSPLGDGPADEWVAVASEVLGCPVEYANPSLSGFVVRSLRVDRPLGFALVMAGIYTTARLGLAGRVTDDVERVLGRPPRDVRAFFEDYRGELTAT